MKRLFAAMPFGERSAPLDHEKPKKISTINFDAVWKKIFLPAVPADFETKRADEFRRPGLIDRMYNEWLFDADIVLADLTFGNPNVYYELGIRQALSKKGTVLTACKGTRLPFDVQNQSVITYDYFAAPTLLAFQTELRQAIENAASQELDSPVHVFLPGLVVGRYRGEASPETQIKHLTQRIQELEQALEDQRVKAEEERLLEKVHEATTAARILSLHHLIAARITRSVRLLETVAISLRNAGYFDEALQNLERALQWAPSDPDLLREIGFVYRKKGSPFYPQAEAYLERALQLNDHDSELHGMLGGLYRRRGEYERALGQYKRAHELQPDDLYALVTIGAMYGALGRGGEARYWYEKLHGACKSRIDLDKADHWTYLCLGEAAVARGDQEGARTAYRAAISTTPPVEHVRSEVEQLEFLVERGFAAEGASDVLPLLRDYLTAQHRP